MKMYVNGVLENTAGGGGGRSTSSVPFQIGHSFAFNRPFKGLIDEVEIFDNAVPPAGINTIFTSDSLGKCSNFASMTNKSNRRHQPKGEQLDLSLSVTTTFAACARCTIS